MIKLIASDLDGTLVMDNGKIDEKVFSLIKVLPKRGIRFVAASGRFCSQLNINFEKVKGNIMLIAHNGAVIRDEKNKDIYANFLNDKSIKNVINLKREFGEEMFLCGSDEAFIKNPSPHMLKVFNFFKIPTNIIKSYDEVDKPICKITYHIKDGVDPRTIDYLKTNLDENLEFVVSGQYWVDIMNKGVSKGKAIKILQDKLNIKRDNTMVFGDYYNDLTMFESAKYSYAMENAPEDVKNHAQFIAKTNNENGVYNVIKDYIEKV